MSNKKKEQDKKTIMNLISLKMIVFAWKAIKNEAEELTAARSNSKQIPGARQSNHENAVYHFKKLGLFCWCCLPDRPRALLQPGRLCKLSCNLSFADVKSTLRCKGNSPSSQQIVIPYKTTLSLCFGWHHFNRLLFNAAYLLARPPAYHHLFKIK